MGRFRIQLLLEDNTWSTRYDIREEDRYGSSSTQWTLVSLNFNVEKYGIKIIHNQINSAVADMCFGTITKLHSVYKMDHVSYFRALLESIPDYRKIVLLMSSNKNDFDLIKDCVFSKNYNKSLCIDFEKIF